MKSIFLQNKVTMISLFLLFILGTSAAGPRLSFVFERPQQMVNWVELGSVPHANQKYPPQGMTFWNGDLFFSNHWKDKASGLYRIDPATMSIKAEAMMPKEATHTSGLTHDGTWLWAADYKTNRIYQIDPEKTFTEQTAVVVASYPTGLKGTSAITFVRTKDDAFFAISDFFYSGKTYLIEASKVSELSNTPLKELSKFSYDNEWFSQGLTWDGTFLYEAVNNSGTDRVRVLYIDDWLAGRASKPCVLTVFSFGGPAAEDLATDGATMWSSDEGTYQFLRLDEYKKHLPSENCSDQ